MPSFADVTLLFIVLFVWAFILGIVNMENRLYIFMILWVVLTSMISSMAAVKTVFVIMAYALLASILMHLSELVCRTARAMLVAQAARPGRAAVLPAA